MLTATGRTSVTQGRFGYPRREGWAFANVRVPKVASELRDAPPRSDDRRVAVAQHPTRYVPEPSSLR